MLGQGFPDEEICCFLEFTDLPCCHHSWAPAVRLSYGNCLLCELLCSLCGKWRRGGAPPVDLRAVCLTRAMVGDVYGCGCSFLSCTSRHITLVCVAVIEKPHKKTWSYSSIDTKVNGKKQSPYKMVGELFFRPNLHLLTLIGKQAIRVSRLRFGGKIIFPTKPTSTHSYWKMNNKSE